MRLLKTFVITSILTVAAASRAKGAPADDAVAVDFFETRVRPVLAASCFSCHSSAPLGGLRLDSAESMLKGGSHGPAVVPGEPEKSLLITAVMHTDAKLKMPMGGSKLKD